MIKIIKNHSITLAIFTTFSTSLIIILNYLFAEKISFQTILVQKKIIEQLLPSELYNNNLLSECYFISDPMLGNSELHRLYIARKDGIPVGAIIETTAPAGYSGPIKLLVGADFSGNIFGVRVTKHNETPGLGNKIELRFSNWINQFTGKHLSMNNEKEWALKKDGGIFDQITGATITPRTIVNSVKDTVIFLQKQLSIIEKMPNCS